MDGPDEVTLKNIFRSFPSRSSFPITSFYKLRPLRDLAHEFFSVRDPFSVIGHGSFLRRVRAGKTLPMKHSDREEMIEALQEEVTVDQEGHLVVDVGDGSFAVLRNRSVDYGVKCVVPEVHITMFPGATKTLPWRDLGIQELLVIFQASSWVHDMVSREDLLDEVPRTVVIN